MTSFATLNRGSLSILIHPLGDDVIEDHTINAMWLGQPFPIDVSKLNKNFAEDPQYPELKLGLSK